MGTTNNAAATVATPARKGRKGGKATPTPAPVAAVPTPTPAPVPVPTPVPTGPAQRACGAVARAALREGVALPAATPAMAEAAAASAAASYEAWRAKGGDGDLSPEAETACAERRVMALRAQALLTERGVVLTNPMAVIAANKAAKGAAKLADLVSACGAPKPPKAPAPKAGQVVDFDAGAVVPVAPTPVAPAPAAPVVGLDKASLAAKLAASGMDAADIVKVLVAL